MTKKVVEYLRSTSNQQVIQEIEGCFNGVMICNSKKLDRILARHMDEVFEREESRYVTGSN